MGFFKSIGKALGGAAKSVGKAVSAVGKVVVPSILSVAKVGAFVPGVGSVVSGIATAVGGLAGRASELTKAIQTEMVAPGRTGGGNAGQPTASNRVGTATRKVVIWK